MGSCTPAKRLSICFQAVSRSCDNLPPLQRAFPSLQAPRKVRERKRVFSSAAAREGQRFVVKHAVCGRPYSRGPEHPVPKRPGLADLFPLKAPPVSASKRTAVSPSPRVHQQNPGPSWVPLVICPFVFWGSYCPATWLCRNCPGGQGKVGGQAASSALRRAAYRAHGTPFRGPCFQG